MVFFIDPKNKEDRKTNLEDRKLHVSYVSGHQIVDRKKNKSGKEQKYQSPKPVHDII